MDFWEHRAVQDKCDLADLEAGRVRDDEDPPEEMDRTRLSPRQMAALKAFHSGGTLKEAAKAAGVTRQTLHRWRTIYPWFAEAMDVWEEGQMIVARSRLVDMADNAIDALAHAIEDGNARLAMMVLRSLRILRTYAPLKPPAESTAREPRYAIPLPMESEIPAGSDRAVAGEMTAEMTKQDDLVPEKKAEETGWKPVVLGEPIAKQSSGTTVAAPLPSHAASPVLQDAGKGAADDGKLAPEQHAPKKLAPAAVHPRNVISDPPPKRPKTAVLTQKAGSAIKNACYSALQEVTRSYEMLRA